MGKNYGIRGELCWKIMEGVYKLWGKTMGEENYGGKLWEERKIMRENYADIKERRGKESSRVDVNEMCGNTDL